MIMWAKISQSPWCCKKQFRPCEGPSSHTCSQIQHTAVPTNGNLTRSATTLSFFRKRACFLTRRILVRRVVQTDSQTSLMQCILTFCVHKSTWLCTKRCGCCVEWFAWCVAVQCYQLHFPEIIQMTSVANPGG